MDLQILTEKLHPLERKVLKVLQNETKLDEIISKSNLREVEISRALQWLENKKIIKTEKSESKIITLGDNGKDYIKNLLPERRFIKSIEKESLTLDQIRKSGLTKEELNIALGLLKNSGSIIFGLKGKLKLTEKGKIILNKKFPEEKFLEKLPLNLDKLNDTEKKIFKNLKKRKDLICVESKKTILTKLTKLGKNLSKIKIDDSLIENLDKNMLKYGKWRGKKFRRYDVEVNVPKIYPGKRHFINESKEYAKQIWLDMGFKEMTGSSINSSFWNFDTLFVPQDHPAREMQDTFFLKGTGKLPKDLSSKVKKQHESSWNYKWSEKEAEKLVLRTHTTVLSAKTISKLKEVDLPAKFFAIGRNYRNESLDWSHLFEFNQSEGIVVDPNANFKHLLGYLKQFFKKMGYSRVRFRPAYFPYTEPSVEIDVYVPEKKTWIELGGAGIFRPEVVKPLLGKDIPVLAWGFGLGRIVSPYYNIKDLRDFYKNDLKQLKEMRTRI